MTTEEKTALLATYSAQIMEHGPHRVMISQDEATDCRRAREQHGINADVIFIRNDGWSLGAPAYLEAEARRTWADAWIGVLRKPSETAEPL